MPADKNPHKKNIQLDQYQDLSDSILSEEQLVSIQALRELAQLCREIKNTHGLVTKNLLDDAREERAAEMGKYLTMED